MQSVLIFRNEKSLGALRLGRLPTLPELGQAFYRAVTINDKKKAGHGWHTKKSMP
jgi:hypothetical protein